jgi:hypothetical protein
MMDLDINATVICATFRNKAAKFDFYARRTALNRVKS